jgi:hypothetical protein
MVIRALVWGLGVAFGVVAVATAVEYYDLVTGRTIVDFIPRETNGEQQRAHITATGRLALGSTLACLASFIVAFSGRAEQ